MANRRADVLPPLWILFLGALALGLWLLWELRDLAVLVTVSYCIAYAFDPILRRGERRGWSRGVGVMVTLAIFVLAVFVVALTALPTLIQEFRDLIANFPHYVEAVRSAIGATWANLSTTLPPGTMPKQALHDLIPSFDTSVMEKVVLGLSQVLLSGYSMTMAVVNLFLLPFIVFYLAVGLPALHKSALGVIPPSYRKSVSTMAKEIDQYVGSYIRGQVLVAITLFAMYAIGLGLIGFKLWFLVAVLAGFGSLVPYLGSIIGFVLGSVMTLATFGDFTHLIYTWTVFGIVGALEGNLISPRIIGKSVGLSPLTIMLSVVAGGTLGGLLGVVLAVPVAAALSVLAAHGREWVHQKIEHG